ncbi:hypothetical protein GALL_505060 [mine drainage metagenome]|uniref:Addiction module antidote protein n=1 Tax=mine drainage metagenome TaxID=410659 RepID=A0A1J5P9G1_9ZZZZ
MPAELEKRVREHVASGLYGSASEVIREALRLFETYQRTQADRLAVLRTDIEQGLNDVQKGRTGQLDLASIKSRGRAELQTRRAL